MNMRDFKVRFAELTIGVSCHYDYTAHFCREYLTDGAADFSVSVTEEDIDREIEVSSFEPSRGYAESICVYREIAKRLPFYHRAVFHGAVISYHGKGYLFTAPSGTGKTTHIRLWQHFLQGVEIVNGDKPILKADNGTVEAFATPYSGKEGFQNHGSITLGALCLLHRGETSRIRRAAPGEALREIIHQIYLPLQDEAAVTQTLDLLERIFAAVPIYILECDISEAAVRTSFEALTGESYERTGKDED